MCVNVCEIKVKRTRDTSLIVVVLLETRDQIGFWSRDWKRARLEKLFELWDLHWGVIGHCCVSIEVAVR